MTVSRCSAPRALLTACSALALACASSPEVRAARAVQRAVSFVTKSVTIAGARVHAAGVVADTARGAEQSWYFSTRPAGEGALRVRVAVEGARYVSASDDGLLFASGDALVRYSHGTWVDRRGERAAIRAAFVDGAIELSVPESVLSRSAYPAVLDPDITLLNATGRIDGTFAADQAYPAFAMGAEQAQIAVAHYRGVASAPTMRFHAVNVSAATTGFVREAMNYDLVGFVGVARPLAMSVGVYRAPVGPAFGNMFVFGEPAVGMLGGIGFSPMDVPELDCNRDGACALSYARIDPIPTAIRRFSVVPGMPAVALGPNGTVAIGDGPFAGEHDVAMLSSGVAAVATAHPAMNAIGAETRVARVASSLLSGVYTGGFITVAGRRPRLACGATECAVLVLQANGLGMARFGMATTPSTTATDPIVRVPVNEGVVAFDVAVIDGGYRVAYVRRTMVGRAILTVLDFVGPASATPSAQNEHGLSAAAVSAVRLASAAASRVSLLTWVEGVNESAVAYGAVITETPDASPDAEAGVDAEADADAEAGVDSAPDADASVATDVLAPDASAPDAAPSRDVVVSDASASARLRFEGGGCDCRAQPTRAMPSGSRAALVFAAFAMILKKRRRN